MDEWAKANYRMVDSCMNCHFASRPDGISLLIEGHPYRVCRKFKENVYPGFICDLHKEPE